MTSSVLWLLPYIAERSIQDIHMSHFHDNLYNLNWYLGDYGYCFIVGHAGDVTALVFMCVFRSIHQNCILCIFFSPGERFPRSNIWSNTYDLYWLLLFFPIREILPTTSQWRKGLSDWVHLPVLSFCRPCVLYQRQNYHQSLLKEKTPSYQKFFCWICDRQLTPSNISYYFQMGGCFSVRTSFYFFLILNFNSCFFILYTQYYIWLIIIDNVSF